jgi:hypothetical protein
MKKTKAKTNYNKRNVALGAAALATAAAGAAAGYYFYVSKDAKANRKIAAAWARDMKQDVVREAKKVGSLRRADVIKLVDKAASAYQSARSVDPKELRRAANELRANWEEVIREARGGISKTAARTKRAAKKAAKKTTRTAKKTAKKAR